jgi:hypothetical protein
MLNLKTIRERLHQAPFTPFELRLSDGRGIVIKHPDFIALGGSVVVVTDEHDQIRRVDALHVVSVDAVSAGRKNGKGAH